MTTWFSRAGPAFGCISVTSLILAHTALTCSSPAARRSSSTIVLAKGVVSGARATADAANAGDQREGVSPEKTATVATASAGGDVETRLMVPVKPGRFARSCQLLDHRLWAPSRQRTPTEPDGLVSAPRPGVDAQRDTRTMSATYPEGPASLGRFAAWKQREKLPPVAARLPPPYRRNAVRAVAFLWGTQLAFLSPALALLLASLFHASTVQIAIVLALYNSACLFTSWLIPRWADRHGDYIRPMLGCALFTIALCGVLATTGTLVIAVAGLVLLGAPAAVGTPILFGFVRHSGASQAEVVRTRAIVSMAWVSGPPAAAAIISAAGGHALVYAIGAVGILVVFAVTALGPAKPAPVHASPHADQPDEHRHPTVSKAGLASLIAAFAALQAANTASVAIITLFVTDSLHLSPLWGGIALGVAAGLEVPALLLLGREARRTRDVSLLGVACVLGAAYYVLAAAAPNGIALIAFQVFNAASYAIITGVGLTLFQSLISGPGAAAGLYSNAQRAGALLAGPLIGIGSLIDNSIRAVFIMCAAVSLLSIFLIRIAAWQIPTINAVTPRPKNPAT